MNERMNGKSEEKTGKSLKKMEIYLLLYIIKQKNKINLK